MYCTHVAAHKIPFLWRWHSDHHERITTGEYDGEFRWYHLFMYIDSWESTADQWLLEVIPTIIFCALTGHWWILIFYWLWSSIIEESIEHNDNINLYPLTSGKWHLIHHTDHNKNYGLLIPIWDMIFGTEKRT